MLLNMIDRDSPFQLPVQPLRDQSQTGAALERVTVALIMADFPPGAHLSEAEIGHRTGFTLATVRASLARLHASGWLVPQARKGWHVQPLTPSHLLELSALRSRLEPMLADIRVTEAIRAPLRVAAQSVALQGQGAPVLLQERTLIHQILGLAPWARARDWLRDLWDMSLRADACFAQLGITRPTLPLLDVVEALGRGAPVTQGFDLMRTEFSARCQMWLAYDHGHRLAPASLLHTKEVPSNAS